ncbi:MAG: hypothetical protein SF052_20170 [Bacteroidia bacterium]|nr:hypothetical protein [Bacteroidia bacterium]
MNPGVSGWLKRFINYKTKAFLEVPEASYTRMQLGMDFSSYEYLYHIIQPTGLMYGYPIRFIESPHPKSPDWTEKDKVKILLAEGYISCGLYFRHEKNQDFPTTIQQVMDDIRAYYEENFYLYSENRDSLFGKKRETIPQIEYILDQRISIKYDWRNFWTSFFHNSFLFFDLINFVQWMETLGDPRPETPDHSIKIQRQNLRLLILQVIAAAAHADNSVKREARELFNYFLQSANLPAHKKKQAESAFNKGVKIEDLDFSGVQSWAMKKYFLELAILTTWANRQISELEREFLARLAALLRLTPEELTHSMVAVENFVFEYWDQVHYLQIKQNYRIVSERLIRRMGQTARINQKRISNEIAESRELVVLLRKSATQALTPEEKEKVREQLLDILRAIPAFTFLLLPGAFITLPILFRIIPKNILYPSSFRDEE